MRKKKQPQILENILVEDFAAEGKSLARVNGKVIFIEKAVPGDVVDIQLYKNKKDWAEAFPLRFKEYAPQRVNPFCEHFGNCGGCQWQNIPYSQQLLFKQKQVTDHLTRIGKIALPFINPIIGADRTEHYRNKLEYTFATKRYIPEEEFRLLKQSSATTEQLFGREPAAGFHARGMFDKVVKINSCHLQEEPTNHLRNAVTKFAVENNYPFYDIRLHSGWLRNMMVRIVTTGQIMVNVVVAYYDETMITALMKFIMQQFPQITTLLYTINPKQNDSIYDLEPVVHYGNGYIIEQLEKFRFKISPKSFFQTNTLQAEKLYAVTREYAALTGTETVYDLYCGTGSIGIFLSDKAGKIIGVETVADAVEDAKQNAALNNIHHASFFAGDVINVCNDDFFGLHGRPDVVITDPPRAGMHEKLVKKLLDIAAPIVVYVSCNPATQARDLNLLNEKYAVTGIQPVDMFPHTHHIENVVQLKLKN